MPGQTATIPQLQTFVWGSLPIRKEAVGQEVVQDFVLAMIQFFPVEQLSQVEPDSRDEGRLVVRATSDARRVLRFVYGLDRFDGYWIIGLSSLSLSIGRILVKWWRAKKENRNRLLEWRQNWVAE